MEIGCRGGVSQLNSGGYSLRCGRERNMHSSEGVYWSAKTDEEEDT
jgi:hypothetical protein